MISVAGARPAAAENIAFITVALDDETRAADKALLDYLHDRTQLRFDPMEMEYAAAIQRLAGWKRGSQPYLARMTPYAYVAAEMLGASFEILGTYNSKATGITTYHSYFVVNRKQFNPNPGLGDLLAWLRSRQATFIYHDKFSTSSYFLPALYFRSQRIFTTSEATDSSDGITSIQVTRHAGTSSDLVAQVASGNADLAAVWDGTKQKIQDAHLDGQVYFIQLPDAIPNDLLVYSRWLEPAEASQLREAVGSMNRTGPGEIHTGDYRWWDEFKKADAARLALANLRRIAAEHPAPVTVQVELAPAAGRNPAGLNDYVEAAQQAVRLSGSEFVLYDEDAYVHKDVTWTLGLIHDGAVDLKVAIAGSEVPPQRFQISFTDLPDLTKRVGGLIHSRMHRIRYVWPYDEKTPTVIRDVDFSVPAGTTLEARKITWLNPGRNAFREGDRFDVRVTNADFFRFSLDDTRFPKAPDGAGWAYDPMSNTAFRVVLVRSAVEPFIMQVLTAVFILLLTSAAVACAVDVRRRDGQQVAKRVPERVAERAARSSIRGLHGWWSGAR